MLFQHHSFLFLSINKTNHSYKILWFVSIFASFVPSNYKIARVLDNKIYDFTNKVKHCNWHGQIFTKNILVSVYILYVEHNTVKSHTMNSLCESINVIKVSQTLFIVRDFADLTVPNHYYACVYVYMYI